MSSETHACHENLSKLVSALTPGSSNYAFVGSFLNATPESVRARDTAIPPKLWDEQMERLEREGLQIQGILWPTKVMGPEVLPQRLKQQVGSETVMFSFVSYGNLLDFLYFIE